MRANYWVLAASIGVLIDQALIFLIRTRYPLFLHSNPIVSLGPWLKIAGSVCVLLLILQITPRHKQRGAYLLVGGLVGNVLSVAAYGGYSDYLPTGVSYVNLGDLLVTIGCAVIAYDLFLKRLGK